MFWSWENQIGDASAGHGSRTDAIRAALDFHGSSAPFMQGYVLEIMEVVRVDLAPFLKEGETHRIRPAMDADAIDGSTAHNGTPMSLDDLRIGQRVRFRQGLGNFVSAGDTGTVSWVNLRNESRGTLASVKLDLPCDEVIDRGNEIDVALEERADAVVPASLSLLPRQPTHTFRPVRFVLRAGRSYPGFTDDSASDEGPAILVTEATHDAIVAELTRWKDEGRGALDLLRRPTSNDYGLIDLPCIDGCPRSILG